MAFWPLHGPIASQVAVISNPDCNTNNNHLVCNWEFICKNKEVTKPSGMVFVRNKLLWCNKWIKQGSFW